MPIPPCRALYLIGYFGDREIVGQMQGGMVTLMVVGLVWRKSRGVNGLFWTIGYH